MFEPGGGFFIGSARAEHAAHEQRGASSDVFADFVVGDARAAHVFERGVDGQHQVELGVDERAVEVEDQHPDIFKIRQIS